MVGSKFFFMIKKKRFTSGSNQLKAQIEFCEKFAKIYQQDTELKIVHLKNGIAYQIQFAGEENFFQNTKSSKKFISHAFCLFDKKKFEKKIIYFSSTGKIIPEGNLEICSSKTVDRTIIDFAKISFIEEKGDFCDIN